MYVVEVMAVIGLSRGTEGSKGRRTRGALLSMVTRTGCSLGNDLARPRSGQCRRALSPALRIFDPANHCRVRRSNAHPRVEAKTIGRERNGSGCLRSTMKVKQRLRSIRTDVEDTPIWQRFRRNVSISVLGSGLSLAIKLGQTALLTKLLKIDDYGRVLIVLNLFVFLDSFFGLRVSDVMFRFFAQLQEQKDLRALKGLLILCLGISLASGLLIYGGVAVSSPWLADRLYPNLGLTPLFNIYGCTVLVSAFSGVYEPILRVHDRFTSIVAPQVLGSLVTFVILCVYFATNLATGFSGTGEYSLKSIVAIFAVGALVQSVPPLVQALRLVRPLLSAVKAKEAVQALAGYRRDLAACFVNSNLSGYLKFAISPGDVFLLGLFSSPAQLALYGLAKQLTAPLALLQTNIQTAITPEITSLVARRKFEQLKRLLARYLWGTFNG